MQYIHSAKRVREAKRHDEPRKYKDTCADAVEDGDEIFKRANVEDPEGCIEQISRTAKDTVQIRAATTVSGVTRRVPLHPVSEFATSFRNSSGYYQRIVVLFSRPPSRDDEPSGVFAKVIKHSRSRQDADKFPNSLM